MSAEVPKDAFAIMSLAEDGSSEAVDNENPPVSADRSPEADGVDDDIEGQVQIHETPEEAAARTGTTREQMAMAKRLHARSCLSSTLKCRLTSHSCCRRSLTDAVPPRQGCSTSGTRGRGDPKGLN